MINNNKNLLENDELHDFEKMIMKWTTFDHYCPSIKAEVIWDMMLSEFIVDMVAYAYRKIYGEQYTADNFYLLAKEFPIEVKKDSLRAAKADYLVASKVDKKIIIVELKSTLGSFSQDQSVRYERCKPKEMFEFYKKLISKEVGSSLYYEKEPLEWKNSQKYAGQIMYMYQQYCNRVTGTNNVALEEDKDDRRSNVKRFHSAFIEKLEEEYVNLDLIYLYVVPQKANAKSSVNSREGKDAGDLCVRMEVKKVYRESEENVEIKDIEIYPEGKEAFVNYLSVNQGQEGINKVAAWETFCKLIDTVNNYKIDFEETKKEYEPYHRD